MINKELQLMIFLVLICFTLAGTIVGLVKLVDERDFYKDRAATYEKALYRVIANNPIKDNSNYPYILTPKASK